MNEQGVEMVCKLRRGLYGLKQSGFLWSQCFRNFLCSTNGKSSDLAEEEVEDVGNGHFDQRKMQCDDDYNMGFKTMTGEPSLFRKRFKLNGRMEEVILGCYVDDLLIATSSMEAREWFLGSRIVSPSIRTRQASSTRTTPALSFPWTSTTTVKQASCGWDVN